MQEQRAGMATWSVALWFVLSVVVTIVNLMSTVRGGGLRWLALVLAALAGWMAFRYGRMLLARYRQWQGQQRSSQDR